MHFGEIKCHEINSQYQLKSTLQGGLCSSRRPLSERDETYIPSKETLSIVKRDMNVNGGISINSRTFLQNMNIYIKRIDIKQINSINKLTS